MSGLTSFLLISAIALMVYLDGVVAYSFQRTQIGMKYMHLSEQN